MSPALATAIEAGRAAAEIAWHYYRRSFYTTIKPDGSPVTSVDIEAERDIRDILLRAFHAHGF